MAFNARLFDFAAGAAAGGAGLLQLENGLAHVYHARAVAGGAGGGGGAGFGAGAVADVALFVRRDGDALFAARCGFFQRDFNIVAQIFALEVLLACPTAAAEHLAENIAEIKAARTAETTEAAGIAVYAGLAELVVAAAFFAVGKDFVGLLDGFEFLFRFLIVGVAVGMVFHRQLAVGLFDFFIGGIAGDAEGLIVVLIAHFC